MDEVGSRVKRERTMRGWSQRDLAKRAKVTAETISTVETGQHDPRPSTLRKLADAFGVEVRELFEEPALPKAEAPEAGPEDKAPPNAPNLEVEEWGPLTRHIRPTEETVVGSVYRTLPLTIDEALPGATDLLEEHVGHAYLSVFTEELEGHAEGWDDERINQYTRWLAQERNWLRRYYNRYFPPENKQVSIEREKQLAICYDRRKKVLDRARDLALERVEA